MVQTELTTLIQGARAGDRQAQETLLAEIQNRVYYHCKKMLKHDSDAQDAAQDVLITVLTSLDKLREPAAFYGWVNGITANRCKHLLTRGSREWQIPESEDGDSMLDNLEDLDQQSVPDAVLDNKETQRLMMELIDALPPEQRMSVLFYYYDEMSVKEIAQAMETTEGTVKSRLNYARKSIKAGVEDLERRGTKLYSIAPLPLLLLLFLRKDASQTGMTAAQSAQVTAAALSAAQAGTAGAGAAGNTAAKAAGSTAAKVGAALSPKLIGGILAVAAAVGIVLGVSQLMKPDEPPQLEDEPPTWSGEQSGPEEPPEPADEGPSPELLALLDSIVYYGDKSQCRLTPEQAAAYVRVINRESDPFQAEVKWVGSARGLETYAQAALFDVGDGTPALFFAGRTVDDYTDYWYNAGTVSIWEYRDGQAVPYAPDGQEPGGYWGQTLALRDGSLFIGGQQGSDGTLYSGGVYPLTGSAIPTVPQTFAGYEPKDMFLNPYEHRYTVEGVEADQEAFEAWRSQWEAGEVLCVNEWDGGVGGSFAGLGDAAAAAEALTQYAAGAAGASSPSGTSGVQPYAQAYAQKVRELTVLNPDMTFSLIYIDGDDIPELLADRTDLDWNYLSLYTFAENNLYVLAEDLLIGIRDYLGYYPRENLIEYSGADLNMNQWESAETYYRISPVHQWEECSAPQGISVEMQYLRGAMTGTEILAQLEQ